MWQPQTRSKDLHCRHRPPICLADSAARAVNLPLAKGINPFAEVFFIRLVYLALEIVIACDDREWGTAKARKVLKRAVEAAGIAQCSAQCCQPRCS